MPERSTPPRAARLRRITRIELAACAGALAVLGVAACTADPVKSLERQVIGMRPKLLESCLPEAGKVEIEGDVERLTYAWTLGERTSDTFAADLDSPSDGAIQADGFASEAPAATGVACEVTVELENGLVNQIEIGGEEPTPGDAACATRVRSCLSRAKP